MKKFYKGSVTGMRVRGRVLSDEEIFTRYKGGEMLARLRGLFNYYESTRRAGHTRLLVDGVANAMGPFFLMTHDHGYAKRILRDCSMQSVGRLLSWSSSDLDRMKGIRLPLAIDNSAIIFILRDCIGVVEQAERDLATFNVILEENTQLRHEVKLFRDDLRWTAEENLALNHKIEEESTLGFLKRKVKKWTHLKS